MKKLLSIIIALTFAIGLNAQTTLTEAIDFSSTAHNGEEINLFEILDGGQYVLIDFFFSTCGPCKEYAPRIVDAYYMLGCNEGDVYFMEVSPTDNNKPYSTDSWINQFNIPYPTLHTETGGVTGDSIYRMYEIAACPTMLLISPDRKIVVNDYHPESAEAMVEYFKTSFGIEENFCGKVSKVSISKTRVNMEDGQGNVLEASTKVHVDFRANAATEKFYYTISESANLTAEDVIANGTLTEEKEFKHTFDSLTPSTTYFVYAQPINIDGGNGEKSVIETRTLCPGDEGEVKVELSVQVTAAYVIANATPNESTSEYHFGFVKKSYYNESETNQFKYLFALANDDYPLCDADSYQVPIKNEETGAPRFDPNTPYYVVAVGRNGEGEWFAPSIKEFMVEQPGDEPEQPGDEPEQPGDEPEQPGDEPEQPGDEPEQPGDEPETHYNINVVISPENTGTVTGAGSYTENTTVTLIATPNSGYRFTNWMENNVVVSTNAEYTFTATKDRDLIANFVQIGCNVVTLTANPKGAGKLIGAGSYTENMNVTVTATANKGYKFVNWKENDIIVSMNAEYSFTITSDRNLAANFVSTNCVVTATANPEEAGTVSGEGTYAEGMTITLTATANKGYKFVNWTENDIIVSMDAEYSFTVTGDIDLVANFISTEGVEELTSSFRLHPNPANDKLYIETLTQTQTLTVEIYDVYGRRQSMVNGQQSMVNSQQS